MTFDDVFKHDPHPLPASCQLARSSSVKTRVASPSFFPTVQQALSLAFTGGESLAAT